MDTPSALTSAVADANVVQPVVSNYRDLSDHLDRAIVRVVKAAELKLAQHLRVGGPIDIGSVTHNGVSHARLAVGVAAVHRHCCGINHAGTWVLTLTTSVHRQKANSLRHRPLPPAPPAVAARAAGRCRPRRRKLLPAAPGLAAVVHGLTALAAALPPLTRALPSLPPALPPLPPPRAAAWLAAGVNGLFALAAGLAGLAIFARRHRRRRHPRVLAHTHRVLDLAVAHVPVKRPNSSNAVVPQPVREHDDTG